MKNIRLISTVHKTRGICDWDSLLHILKKDEPAVIFNEMSPLGFESINKGLSPLTLEIRAIRGYSRDYSFSYIAVDTYPLPDIHFKNAILTVFDLFDQNPEYLRILKNNEELTYQLGFSYLNSSIV